MCTHFLPYIHPPTPIFPLLPLSHWFHHFALVRTYSAL
jgi:hypothetical protein